MRHHIFGTNSTKNLNEAEKDLQLICREALIDSPFDFGVHEAHRPPSVQKGMYDQGRTKPGVIITYKDGSPGNMSTHNYMPSKAVDIHYYLKGRPDLTWDKDHLLVLAGVMLATANRLYREGRITHLLRWGGNWDMDTIIVTKDEDERFFDPVHYELYKP